MSEIKHPTTILLAHSSDEMYGADVILLELVKGLDPQEFRPIVVLPTDLPFDGALSRALREQGVTVYQTDLAVLRRKYFKPLTFVSYLRRFVVSVVWLRRLIRSEQVDIVHSNTLAVIPGAVAAWLTQTRHVWHVLEIIVKPRFLWRLTAGLAARLADVIVTASGPTYDHLCKGNSGVSAKAMVFHYGIDVAKFDAGCGGGQALRRAWGIAPDEPLVGMVGRVSHWKGQQYFLQVAAHVHARHPNARFALVGGTSPGQENLMDELLQEVRRLGLTDHVIIQGFRSDIPAVLEAFDLFVSPSILPDPFPTVVLEAMAGALPVVANAQGGCLEMIDEGVTGFLVEPGNEEAMAAAIGRLIAEPELRGQMGKQARCRLEKMFSLAQFKQNWLRLYRTLVAAPIHTPIKPLLD